MKIINIGFGNMVSAGRIVAIASPDSAPIKRLIQDSREAGKLIDVTCGRKTRCVIITDSDHVILSALQNAGFTSTQATISRDIKEMRIIKELGPNGMYRYSAAIKQPEPTCSSCIFSSCRSNFSGSQTSSLSKKAKYSPWAT